MKLEIKGQFPSLNEVLGLAKSHWSKYAKLKRELTLSVALEAKSQGLKPVQGPVHIIFDWYEKDRRRDVDNIIGFGQKPVIDGLVEAGILKNDGQKQVPMLSHRFHVDKQNPRIRVWMEEL